MAGRYAVYYAPDPRSDLYRLGSAFLGWDLYEGKPLARPDLWKIPEEIIIGHTRQASIYGFHGTIVAPFETAATEAELGAALDLLAREFKAFELGRPRLTIMDETFAALRFANGLTELRRLEERCVREMSPFRRPLSEEDMARRGALSPKLLANLKQWGYHLVLDEFNFHLTLADSLPGEPGPFMAALEAYLEPALKAPLVFDCLGLFYQPWRTAPFSCRKIFLLQDFEHEHR